MPVYVIWENQFQTGKAAEGLAINRDIWLDMAGFDGYLGHTVFQDQDKPEHLVVVSKWATREAADRTQQSYATSPRVESLKPFLAARPSRIVSTIAETHGGPA